MNQIKIINLVVWFLFVIGIMTIINFSTDNSLASIYKVFNPCDIKNINNCSNNELKILILENLE
ncbi:MAG TPA: hypothetical protein PKU93_03660 [Candidatus Pacearchaeota archaeon]|nr:hypothetical protein [Candidatus Pacearchaeota archaeon]